MGARSTKISVDPYHAHTIKLLNKYANKGEHEAYYAMVTKLINADGPSSTICTVINHMRRHKIPLTEQFWDPLDPDRFDNLFDTDMGVYSFGRMDRLDDDHSRFPEWIAAVGQKLGQSKTHPNYTRLFIQLCESRIKDNSWQSEPADYDEAITRIGPANLLSQIDFNAHLICLNGLRIVFELGITTIYRHMIKTEQLIPVLILLHDTSQEGLSILTLSKEVYLKLLRAYSPEKTIPNYVWKWYFNRIDVSDNPIDHQIVHHLVNLIDLVNPVCYDQFRNTIMWYCHTYPTYTQFVVQKVYRHHFDNNGNDCDLIQSDPFFYEAYIKVRWDKLRLCSNYYSMVLPINRIITTAVDCKRWNLVVQLEELDLLGRWDGITDEFAYPRQFVMKFMRKNRLTPIIKNQLKREPFPTLSGNECFICRERTENMVHLPCKHTSCTVCSVNHQTVGTNCFICRKRITGRSYVYSSGIKPPFHLPLPETPSGKIESSVSVSSS